MSELAFAYVGSAFEKKDASVSSKAQASAALQSLRVLNKLPLFIVGNYILLTNL